MVAFEFRVPDFNLLAEDTARNAARALGIVLAAGALALLVAAIGFDHGLSSETAAWAFAMMFIAIGVLVAYPAWPNAISAVGSVIAFIGASTLMVLFLSQLALSPQNAGDRGTVEMIGVIATGGGIAIIGIGLALAERGSLIVGGIAALMAIAWTIAAAIDFGSDTERLMAVLPALALLAVAILAVWPNAAAASQRFAGRSLVAMSALGSTISERSLAIAESRQLRAAGPAHAAENHDGAGPGQPTIPVIAWTLIGLGVALLLAEWLIAVPGSLAWPFMIIVPATFVAWVAFAARPVPISFAIGACVAIVVGLLLLYQEASGHWASWSYSWTLPVAAVGIALAIAGIRGGKDDLVSRGTSLIALSSATFLVLGTMFDHVLFDMGDSRGYFVPIVTIALGGIALWIHMRADRMGLTGSGNSGPGSASSLTA